MIVASLDHAGRPIGRRLGAGGEADVHEVPGRPSLAFKRYRVPDGERTAKLRVMLAHPPAPDDGIALAWPTELVPGERGEAAGFLMPRIDLGTNVPLFRVYNPRSRRQVAPGFTWRYLLRTARNVAAVVDSVHRAGFVVGDLNESNLLVSNRAVVSLVDCDSMQVTDPVTGEVHRCRVGKPEFTAPELQRADLAVQERTPATDAFALAVLVFQLLMEGVHPFGGIWRGRGEPPDIGGRISRARFPYRWTTRSSTPPPMALDLGVLPPAVRGLVRTTFTTGMRRPLRRPSPGEWVAALEAAEMRLTSCRRSAHHEYGDHLRRCPWCDRIDAGLPDPFPGPAGTGLGPTPPTRATLVQRAVVAGARSTGRTIAGAASRVLPVGWASGALRGELPVLVVIAAVGSVTPPPVLALALVMLLPLLHAASQAISRPRPRRWTVVATARFLPEHLALGIRAVSVAAGWGVAFAAALTTLSVLRAGDGSGIDAFVDRAAGQVAWGSALAAVMAVRWPRPRDPRWAAGISRVSSALRAGSHGRRSVASWVIAGGSVCLAVLSR